LRRAVVSGPARRKLAHEGTGIAVGKQILWNNCYPCVNGTAFGYRRFVASLPVSAADCGRSRAGL
jgi:hypothetical protein